MTGAESAVDCVWRDLQRPLLRYLQGFDRSAAEDLASDVWVEVARRLPDFSGGETELRAFVFTVARHKAIDHCRKAQRRRTSPVAWLPERPGEDDSEALALDALATSATLELLGTLPPEQARVVALRVIAGLDGTRVARLTGRSPGAVRVIQHRALRTLARRVNSAPARVTPTPAEALFRSR
ncbi:MAG: RNA polymerase sigma factor [Acidimicrobiia bacterium]